ncbi:TMV resistance protein N-like [Solanum stenotomum]|uniref:TMV resistance protein N-like n=1 Tax=Solanum stenotomum TaxID=172797 RepID=UPI0020D04234|nr:TMV resistance protein N-like [Solanum stenotomum]
MASTSSSCSGCCPRWKYDVFLSFRGEDTRKTIIGYLYERLTRKGIIAFQDDKRLERGDSIPEELLKAIQDSQVALIIFSGNYATSRWCLDELVKIMECTKDENEKIVMPVFYGVEPSHVRNQSDSFAEAFAKHESKYKDDGEGMQKVKGWRTALTAAANLKGYVFGNGVESDYIECIVDEISFKCKSSVSYLHKVVGIDAQLEKVESLLKMEINDVRIVWIWGMGGVGKTTIAKTIFYNLSSKFKDSCFLEDIKENKHRMHSLQNILLSKLLGEKENCVNNKEEGKHLLARRLRFKKVLIVLDDLNHIDQLDYLAGDLDWFGNGSRIIATTRDKRLIRKDVVHEVETLLDCDAIKLFNQYAFMKEVPDECFKDLMLEIVSHAKGHPLALKVWGSSLHGKGIIVWRSALDRMKKNPGSEIIENLKISYDGLEPEEQEIFLDIACFFRGNEKKEVMQILESCDFPAEYGLSVLIDKSLVFISSHNKIHMHDLIQDMGKYVVKMQKDPGERSRLWLAEDFEEVMVNNTVTKATEAIWFRYRQKICFSKEAMNSIKNLRILYICQEHAFTCINCHDGSIEYLSNNLRWLSWNHYPWESLPAKFEPKKLVYLQLRFSSLRHLWTETKYLRSLQKLDLRDSKSLTRTPNFTGMPNLEYLYLRSCSNLEEVHDSLGCSRKLIWLDLSDCGRLKRFPCVNLESLEYLTLQYCSSLEKFPELLGRSNLELEISVRSTGIRELPASIQYQTHITKLDLSRLEDLVALPRGIGMLKSLVDLYLWGCKQLESLPEEVGDLENLKVLDAQQTLISRPPSSIMCLNKLKSLKFGKDIEEIGYSEGLEDEVYFVFPPVAEGLCSLEYLDLSYCNLLDGGLPEDIGCLSSLKKLYLNGNNFVHLPRSIAHLGALQSLNIKNCKRLKELPDFTGMPNLEYLYLRSCSNLEEVHDSLGCSRKLIQLDLSDCERLQRFPCVNVECLEYLDLRDCSSLEKFPEMLGRMKPELEIYMRPSGIREIPSCIIQQQACLTELNLSYMINLEAFPSNICKLKGLVKLNVSYCPKLESLPEEIGDLENLEWLDATWTLISRPPSSIVHLNKLKFLSFKKYKSKDGVCFVFPQVNEGLHSLEHLNLNHCNLIDGGLPEDIGCLSSLKELYLCENNFEHLPRSITQLGALLSLDLSQCKRLKELPDFTGMPNLETLNLSNCMNLEEVDHSVGFLKKLCTLKLTNCKRLKMFPVLCIDSLEYMVMCGCSSLENFPEIIGSKQVESEIHMLDSVMRDLNSVYISFPDSLSQNIISLQHDISGSDSSSLRVFTIEHPGKKIPRWFHHQGTDKSVSVNLPQNWYVLDNFVGFAVCYSGCLTETTAQLIPLCDDGISWMTLEVKSSHHSKRITEPKIHFFLVPLARLWDPSKANGKTPNDYGIVRLSFSGKMKEYGCRLLYKDEPDLEALLQIRKNNDKPTENSMNNEASCSSCKRHSNIRGRVTSLFRNFAALSCKPRNFS